MLELFDWEPHMMKKSVISTVLLVSSFLTGCSTVADQESSTETPAAVTADSSAERYAKEFNAPPKGWSGLYLYRTCNIVTAKLVCHQNSPLNCQILSSKIFLSKRS